MVRLRLLVRLSFSLSSESEKLDNNGIGFDANASATTMSRSFVESLASDSSVTFFLLSTFNGSMLEVSGDFCTFGERTGSVFAAVGSTNCARFHLISSGGGGYAGAVSAGTLAFGGLDESELESLSEPESDPESLDDDPAGFAASGGG
jgi:hypothetical protein